MMDSPVRPMELDEDEVPPLPPGHFQWRPSSDDHHTPISKMMMTQDCHFYQTPPLFRIVHNPFDPPTSAHLKQRLASPSIFRVLSQNDSNDKTSTCTSSVFDWSIEQRADLHPIQFSDENLIQIDAAVFDENLMQRYQRATHEFCSSKLHLPTPAALTGQQQQQKTMSTDVYGYYCTTSTLHTMMSPFPHFDIKSTTSIFQRDFQCRPPGDFDSCVMEPCVDTSLDASYTNNNTNQSSHSSIGGNTNNNVSYLKRRLFEDEEEEDADVNLIPEEDEQSSGAVTSTQRCKSPPRCDSETEDDHHRISSPSHRLRKEELSPISSSFLFDVDCSPIKKN